MSDSFHFSASLQNRLDDWQYFRRSLATVVDSGSEEDSARTQEEVLRDGLYAVGGRFALSTGDSFIRKDWGLMRGTLIAVQFSKKSSSDLVNDSIQNLADLEVLLPVKLNGFVDLGIAWRKESPWMSDKLPWTVGIAGFFGDNPMESSGEEFSFFLIQGKITYHHTITNRLGSIACRDLGVTESETTFSGEPVCRVAFDYPDTLEKSPSTESSSFDPEDVPVTENFTEFYMGFSGEMKGRLFNSETEPLGKTQGLPIHAIFSAGQSFYTTVDRFEYTFRLDLETPINPFITFFVNGSVRGIGEEHSWNTVNPPPPFSALPHYGQFLSVESGIRVFISPP